MSMPDKEAAGSQDFDKLKYLAVITENVTDIITIIDAVGTIRYESPSIQTVLGYAAEELIGKNAFSLVHPDDYKNVFGLFLKSAGQKDKVEIAEFRFKHKDGSWRYLESSAKNLLFDPSVHGVVVSSRDITGRRHAESLIRLQSHALEAASNGIVITDVKGDILWVNAAFTKMTGYEFEEVLGKNPRILKSGEQPAQVYEALWKTILAGETWAGEIINRRKDGTLYFEKQTITPVKNGNGEITQFVAVKEDVSGQKKMEAQFRQAQKMEAVGRLAGGVAHDFNNLLTIILWQSDILLEKAASETDKSSLMEIKNAGKRAANLTRQLLAFSRKQIFQSKVTDLNEIVAGTDKMIRRLLGEDVELVTLLGENLGPVKVDVSQIEQVIMNLAVNARDAMPGGGKLVLETSKAKIAAADAVPHPELIPGEYLRLKVTDTGLGMPPEVKAHLFEPFFTTKEKGKGTGLGLATIYGIIKQSKGYVYAESEIGKGTAFTILLPPAEEQAAPQDAPVTVYELPKGNERVLVAEDEDLVRGLAVNILTRQGFKVLEARNGLDALEKVRKNQGGPIHLLLTDMVMPYMGGGELAEKIAAEFPKIKIMFTSGYTDHSVVQKWIDQGSRFLQKPYNPSELLITVREVLDGRPYEAQS
jgi:two-component system cell cycle sensor histidine kinase/response regulator CckA